MRLSKPLTTKAPSTIRALQTCLRQSCQLLTASHNQGTTWRAFFMFFQRLQGKKTITVHGQYNFSSCKDMKRIPLAKQKARKAAMLTSTCVPPRSCSGLKFIQKSQQTLLPCADNTCWSNAPIPSTKEKGDGGSHL